MPYTTSQFIRRQLLRLILNGDHSPTQMLPSIGSLAKTFKVSTATVQKAIHSLTEQGLIDARPGSGLFVKPFQRNASKGGGRIALLHPDKGSYLKGYPYPGQVIDALRGELEPAGFTLVPWSLEKPETLVLQESLRKMKLSGLALFEIDNDCLISELRELCVPMVSLDFDAYRHGISSVIFDNPLGCFQATKHLMDMGHRHIVFMKPLLKYDIYDNPFYDVIADRRLDGYRIAMQAGGLPVVVREYHNRASEIQEIILELFSQDPVPTAFVCVGDWSARMIAEQLQVRGLEIPRDISIVGFGDIPGEFAPGRQITSVRVDYRDMGQSAGRLLLGALQGHGRAQRRVLATRLVPHESVGAPAAAGGAKPRLLAGTPVPAPGETLARTLQDS